MICRSPLAPPFFVVFTTKKLSFIIILKVCLICLQNEFLKGL